MPRYFLSLGNCLPPPQAIEDLSDDKAARALAITVAGELGRNRYGRSQECVVVLSERGQLIHKAWTSSDSNEGSIFSDLCSPPEHSGNMAHREQLMRQ